RSPRPGGDRAALRGDPPKLARAVPRPLRRRPLARLRRALRPHVGLLPRVLRGGFPRPLAARRPARPRPLIDSYWQLLLIGIGAADGLLMVLYVVQRRTGDATLV